jgi:hypothetical protein
MTARSYLLLTALALSATTLGPTAGEVLAQTADAVGRPLPLSSLPAGTVSVRVIAGAVSAPHTGVDVTLTVDGAARIARTDAAGRAMFSGIPAGATVVATVAIAGDGGAPAQTLTSESFAVQGGTGFAVLLTSKPLSASGGAPFAGGGGMAAGGMPEPRRASGQAQAFASDPAGTLSVALTYNDLKDPSPPAGVPVSLVAYRADDSVAVLLGESDAGGVARFPGLDVSGSTAYYAVALLPRAGAVDRLVSRPITLADIGVRVILSSLARDATDAPLDDGDVIDEPLEGVPAGGLSIGLMVGAPDGGVTVELVDAATGKTVASQTLPPTQAAGRHLEGAFTTPELDPGQTAGSLELSVLAGSPSDRGPVEGVAVYLEPVEPAGAPPAIARASVQATTDAQGVARFDALAAGAWRARVAAPGASGVLSPEFTVGATGGLRMAANLRLLDGIPTRIATWSPAEVAALIAAGAETFYAQVRFGDNLVRSGPLVPTPALPTSATLEAYAPVVLQFQFDGGVDDKYLGMQGSIAIYNRQPKPYLDGPDGIVIPIPRGAVGAVVGEDDKARVVPERGGAGGFRIRRAIPPRGMEFQAGFSLLISHGEVRWDYDLPLGAVQSRIAIVETPGMSVQLPDGVEGEHAETKSGLKFFRVTGISIPPGQRMTMRLSGLPQVPAWKVWAPRLVGLTTLLMIGLGLVLALRGRERRIVNHEAARKARVAMLMDELVAIDSRSGIGGPADGPDAARRAQLIVELERLWPASSERAAP